jgi:orotidine-5'-phosphate decarboxylase
MHNFTDPPVPILALDVPEATRARELLQLVPDARWVKVGLQLFTAAGPAFVRELVGGGHRVFLDLKLHDIPNTVARAVESASALGVDLLTVHASGGRAMLSAASAAASGESSPRLLAVTLLTSLSASEAAEAWGRPEVDVGEEVRRLAGLASDCGIDGVVASVHEASLIRAAAGRELLLLTPGIRLADDEAGDQFRIATPQEAARAGVNFLVIGRAVTAASDPAAAWKRVAAGILPGARE